MIIAMSAVENAAAHFRLIPKTTPNVGGRERRERVSQVVSSGDA